MAPTMAIKIQHEKQDLGAGEPNFEKAASKYDCSFRNERLQMSRVWAALM